MSQKIERRPKVCGRTGLSPSTIYRLVKAGKFPAPIQLSARAVGWQSDAVDAWLGSRARAATQEGGQQ